MSTQLLEAQVSFLRGGYLLTINSLVSSALGFAFWLIAARRFAAAEIGFGSAAIAAVAVVAGIGALGLSSAFLRYVPRSGRVWGTLVVRGYGAAAGASVLLGATFALLIGQFNAGLGRLGAEGWVLLFVCGTGVWAIFSLQDVVLIARRRPEIVVLENIAVAIARIALLFVSVLGTGAHGIFIAWLLPTVAASIVINAMLARDAVGPAGWRSLLTTELRGHGIIRYCFLATVGSAATVLMVSVMPVLVTAVSGVAVNAAFFLPWAIAVSLQVISTSMSAPLSAEIARGLTDEREATLRVLRHAAGTIAAIGLPLLVAVPPVLAWLGPSYRVERSLLALLLGATLVNSISAVYLARARARGDVRGPALAQWSAAIILIGGSALLLPHVGLNGVGWAALAAQCAAAAIALSRNPHDELPRIDQPVSLMGVDD